MKLVHFACLAGALSAGCVGARTTVIAPTAEVPVSMSRGVRDAKGDLVPAAAKKIVGKFEGEYTAWNILWAAVKLTPEKDISNDVNAQVRQHHGHAVTNLEIETRHCALNYFVFPFALIPFWPSCANVKVRGNIIQVSGAPAAPGPERTAAHADAPDVAKAGGAL